MPSEVELAEPVIGYFEELKHDVYQEVKVCGGCADIITVLGKIVTVVEVKTSLTIALLHQAYEWKRWANYIYIAVPYSRDSARHFAYRICRDYGFGVILVNRKTMGVRQQESAALNRKSEATKILSALRPEHKTYCKAGSRFGQRFTPFQATCDALRLLVKSNPGIQLDDAIKQITHHYASNASARHSLFVWLVKGVVKGIRVERRGKKLKLFLES